MWRHACRAGDVAGFSPAHEQRVGDQRPMTAPWHRFGAHQRESVASGQFEQFVDCSAKLRRLHVIGVAAKRQIPPAGVGRVWRRAAQPAQRRAMHVGNPRRTQRLRQILTIELRIVSGPRHRPHINDSCDSMRPQKTDKLGDGTRGMADREYAGCGRYRANSALSLGFRRTDSGFRGSASTRRPGAFRRRSNRCTHDRASTRVALAGNRPARLRAENGPGSAMSCRAAATCSHTFHSSTPRTRPAFR